MKNILNTVLFLYSMMLVALFSNSAGAQHFFDDFTSEMVDVGTESNQWSNIWPGDPWTTALNPNGLSPKTDITPTGDTIGFGSPADGFDNGLVAGDTTWNDYAMETDFFTLDDDGLGVIFRYSSVDSYYVLVMSNDQMPGPNGNIEFLSGQPETRLYRISQNVVTLLVTVANTAYTPNETFRQRLRVEVAGNQIKSWLSLGDATIDTSEPPFLDYRDDSPDALTQGGAGPYAFTMGNATAGTYFNSIRIEPLDSDKDGLDNDLERQSGTDPFDADSDDDGVMDGSEFNWSEDTDADSLINALDFDSDNDGLPDGLEQRITEPLADTNLAAGHFIADVDPKTGTDPLNSDSDNGGALDGEEDINKNGKYEFELGETDPNNPLDDANLIDTDSAEDTETGTSIDSNDGGDSDNQVDTDSSQTDTDTEAANNNPDGGLGQLSGGHSCNCELVGNSKLSFFSALILLY